ncbi:hypothetical protein NT01EI_0594 [Edwardsiella ictaluri 93-146]|uniref:Uncharacterized protein n=1 Tax=Edwardsiella ictaluri (strain 93-146) TaxID=634503 RepID=C5B749_EDWI9|nr:hypothetical protein NT01EI_0594 [Edwardsiella ictaluri 93-146]
MLKTRLSRVFLFPYGIGLFAVKDFIHKIIICHPQARQFLVD